VGNQPPGEIRRIIDDELQRAAAKQAQGAK
jgi:hypothetical protein